MATQQGGLRLQIFLQALVEKVGWPGAILMFGAFFVTQYATLEQKQRLIEMYILGRSTPYGMVLLGVLFAGVLAAQKALFDRKLAEGHQRLEVAEAKKDSYVAQLESANVRLAQLEAKAPVKTERKRGGHN